jgi:hypothetical protein
MCGKLHKGSLVSSKKSLADFEVLDVYGDGPEELLVQEVDICSTVPKTEMVIWVPSNSVELFEEFYSRMH